MKVLKLILFTLLFPLLSFGQTTTIRGEMDDTSTTAATEGGQFTVRETAQRGLHTNLRNASGAELGTATDPVNVEGTLACTLSEPISVDDNGSSLTIDASSLPLPTGASTSANQTTIIGHVDGVETTLSSLLTELQLKADLTETQPVSAASLPLPAGASTSANQSTEITSLQLIDDVVHATNGALSKAAAIAGQLDDAATTAATENNVATSRITAQRALHMNLRNDSGAELGTATDPVNVEGTVAATLSEPISVDDNGSSLTVDGTIAATQSGTWSNRLTDGTDTAQVFDLAANDPLSVAIVDGAGSQITSFGGGTEYTVDAAAPANPVGATFTMERDDSLSTLTEVEGDWTNPRASSKGALWVVIPDASGDPITSFGGGTQYTEDAASVANPVGGQLMARRRDALTSEVTTDGDVVALNSTTKGEIYVKQTDAVPATQSGTWDEVGINDSGNSITVDNPTLSVLGGGTEAAALRVTIANDSTGLISVDDNGSSLTIDGTVTCNAGSGTLATSDTATLVDDAAFTPATSRVMMSGFEFDDASPDSVNEGDAGAVRMSANRNLYSTIRDAAGNERGVNVNASNQLSVSVDNTVTVASHAVTNAGTFVVQENGAALTALQLLDDVVATDGSAALTKMYQVGGTDGTNAQILKTDTAGEAQVDVLTLPAITGTVAATQSGTWTVQPGNTANSTPWLTSIHDGTTKATVRDLAANDSLNVAIVDGSGTQITTFGGGSQYTEADVDTTITGTAIMWEDGSDTLRAVSAAKPLPIDITDTTVAVTQSGTWDEVGINDSGNSITVDAASLPLPTGAATLAEQQTQTTALQIIDDLVTTEDQASANLDEGVVLLGRRTATPANTSGLDLDYEALQLSAGRLWTSCTIDAALPIGTNNIGDVDVLTMPTVTVTDGSGAMNVIVDSGSITADTELPAAAALADAASATPTTATIGTIPLLMNATTVDRQRAVVNSLNSTGTGIAAAGIIGQLDDSLTGVVTENQFSPVRISSRRGLLVEGVSGGTALPVTDPKTATMTEATGSVTTSSTTILASSASRVGGYILNSSANAIWIRHNGTAATLAPPSTRIVAGGMYDLTTGGVCYTGAITAISTVASSVAVVTSP